MTSKKRAEATPQRNDEVFRREAIRLWESSGKSAEVAARAGHPKKSRGHPLQTVAERKRGGGDAIPACGRRRPTKVSIQRRAASELGQHQIFVRHLGFAVSVDLQGNFSALFDGPV